MSKCSICGKILKNPSHPNHINSNFHQKALIKQEELQNRSIDKLKNSKSKFEEKRSELPAKASEKILNKKETLIDKDGYLRISEIESFQRDNEEQIYLIHQLFEQEKVLLRFSDLDE
ncbi:MAG: hypothetical protein GF311_23295, partial [Candidatus Lokiarchaeota archaeon]|nr:hypothetical protein [Candidatus Lokiarchaeota archaeon]